MKNPNSRSSRSNTRSIHRTEAILRVLQIPCSLALSLSRSVSPRGFHEIASKIFYARGNPSLRSSTRNFRGSLRMHESRNKGNRFFAHCCLAAFQGRCRRRNNPRISLDFSYTTRAKKAQPETLAASPGRKARRAFCMARSPLRMASIHFFGQRRTMHAVSKRPKRQRLRRWPF